MRLQFEKIAEPSNSISFTLFISHVIPYAISMDKLFEMYIRSYLKMAGVRSFYSHDSGIRLLPYDDKTPVLIEGNKAYANYIRGNVKPDIILYNPENGKYAVFDVKYKDSLNSRFSRSDRMQVLAYGLMFDAENIGNIFPTQDGTSNIYYISNKINSNGSKIRQYNQLEIAIDTNWIYAMSAKSGGESIGLLEYLNELLK